MDSRGWREVAGRALAVLVGVGLALGMASGRAPAAGAQADSEAQLRELAEALLLQSYGSYGGPSRPGSQPAIDLLPGQQPPGLDFALPVPPQGRLLGSAVQRANGRLVSAEMVAEAPLALAAMQEFYQRALTELGWWSPTLQMTARTGGFQAVPTGTPSVLFCGPDSRQYLNLTVVAKSGAASLARVTIIRPDPSSIPAGMAVVPPCAAPGTSPQPVASSAVQLPALTAPADARLFTVGVPPSGPPGTPGGQSATSTAMATAPQVPAELEAYFAQQLAAAGWTRQGGQAEGMVAWSLWQVPDPPGTQGFLLVLATPGEDQRFLLLRADPAPQAAATGGQPAAR
jgi:hypothetical protein